MDNEKEKDDIDKATGQPPPPKSPARPQEELTPLGAPVDPRFPAKEKLKQEQAMPRGIPKAKSAKSAKSANKTATKRLVPTAAKKKKKKSRKG